jgi:aminoglycoside 2'-N-acetyltransferase I
VAEPTALDRVTDLCDADRDALRSLSAVVYAPGQSTSWSGRQIEWSAAEWCVRVRDDDGMLASYVGVSLRDAKHDGRPVRIGGIGGVKTHPAARRRGLASMVRRAIDFLREQPDIGFAVLVCGSHLIEYYRRLGWREFGGRLLVQQRGATVEFSFNRVMTHGIWSAAPKAGIIDLLGPPW